MLRKKRLIVAGLAVLTAAAAFFALFVGSSNMSLSEGFQALLGSGKPSQVRILQNIRLPRILAALLAGAALALSGLIMQTTLNNAMASPATLGVSNAAVFGANLSIIAFAGGFLSTGHNLQNYMASVNPYATGLMAFVFAAGSVLFVLLLCKLRAFSPMRSFWPASRSASSGPRAPRSYSSSRPTSAFPPRSSGRSATSAARRIKRT